LKKLKCLFLAVITQILVCKTGLCQNANSPIQKAFDFSDKIFNGIDSKARSITEDIERENTRYINKILAKEKKLRKKMDRLDSGSSSKMALADKEFETQLKQINGVKILDNQNSQVYVGRMDSLVTALKFLQASGIGKNVEDLSRQSKEVLDNLRNLQGTLNKTQQIQELLEKRKAFIKQQLGQLGLVKEFNKYKQSLYYYKQKMNEYRELLSNPKELASKSLDLLMKVPEFRNFFNKNSELASLFRLPGSSDQLEQGLDGLQSRADLNAELSRLSASLNSEAFTAQASQSPQDMLKGIKDKFNASGNTQDLDMPDFRPNNEKTKTFLKRLELGFTIQTTRGNYYFPVTSNIGFTVSYKINSNNVLGIGSSFAVGWGKDWKNIKITAQGFTLQSFWDSKIKGNLWISGGLELTHVGQISQFQTLTNVNIWDKSALLGLTKKYSIGKKFNAKIQLLYDFLYRQNIAHTQPLVFRIGYNLK